MDVSCELSYELYRDGLATGGITTVRWVRSTSESTRSRVCVRQGAIRAAGGGSFREPPCQVNFANQAFTTIYSIYCQTFYMVEICFWLFQRARSDLWNLNGIHSHLWQIERQLGGKEHHRTEFWILNSKFYFTMRYGRYSWGGKQTLHITAMTKTVIFIQTENLKKWYI